MEFAKYVQVKKFDDPATQGLTAGKCLVFPKLDGIQVSCWLNDDDQFRSAGKDGKPVPGFDAYSQEHKDIGYFLQDYPYLRLYGEFIGKSPAYSQDCWNKWFVTEVCSEKKSIAYSTKDENGISVAIMDDGHYCLPFDVYMPLMKKYNLDFVAPLKTVENPTAAQLQEFADKENKWHSDGECGEGLVIKRYDFKDASGAQVWAKVIRTGYQKQTAIAAEEGSEPIEERLASEIVTAELVKDVATGLENPNPGLVINAVWTKITEECLPAAKAKHHNPAVDMKRFRKDCETKIRAVAPELFHVKSA